MKLLILADDFTGAMDTGVQLSKARIKTLVFSKLPEEKQKAALPPCEVLVFNTNLRHETPETAYRVISETLKTYYEPGLYFYIKTDSALRGNISATLAAAADALRIPLHFIPAFPDAGRTVKDGVVYIEGTPLADSVFRNDPRSPMTESRLEKIVTRDYPLSCCPVPCPSDGFFASAGRSPAFHGEAEIVSEGPEGVSKGSVSRIYIYDGETNDDLQAVASALKERNALTLTAGCAGFAGQFPKYLDFQKESPYTPQTRGPILFLSGSANAITFRQLAKARAQGYPFFLMKAYLEAAVRKDPSARVLGEELAEKAITLLEDGESVVLATAQDADSLLDLPAFSRLAGSVEAVHEAISRGTSRLVRRILEASDISCLAVFGGDTVAGILEELECPYVHAKGEIDTGVPLCLFPDNSPVLKRKRTTHLVTKSGGLGCEDIVKSIDNYFNSL